MKTRYSTPTRSQKLDSTTMLFSAVVWPRAASAAAATCATGGAGDVAGLQAHNSSQRVHVAAVQAGGAAISTAVMHEGGAAIRHTGRPSDNQQHPALTASASNQSARPLPGSTAGR